MDELDKTIEDFKRLFSNDSSSNMETLGEDGNDSVGDASFFGKQQEYNKLIVMDNFLVSLIAQLPLPIS